MIETNIRNADSAGKVLFIAKLLAVVWTVLIVGSFSLYYRLNQEQILVTGRSKALMAFERDRLYRRWVSLQGGVYVPIDQKTPPNPLLSHVTDSDIVTPAGKRLTLLNAAYMARQVFESVGATHDGPAGIGHMTSLKPIRAENRPDPWERVALEKFQHGIKEVSEVQVINGRSYMRLIKVAITEKPCLNCHRVQGYHEGDIRGGVGVTVPISDILEANRPQMVGAAFGHGLTWLLGLGVLTFGARRLSGSISELQQSEKAFKSQAVRLASEVEERHLSENARRESERFLSTVIATEPECVKMLGPDGALLMMNPAGLAMIQADSFEQVKGQSVYQLIAPEHREAFVANTDCVFHGKTANFEFEILGLKGRRLWLESKCVPFRDDSGRIVSALCITRDITERKRHVEELRELSLADELTGLTNRRGFMLLAQQQMKVADRNGSLMALVFVDLDGLKEINDTFGHGEGDRAIIDCATILRTSFRASDIVARVGGDEFVALSVEPSSAITSRLTENLHAHNLELKRPYELSWSYGISVYDPDRPVRLEVLLEQSDRLMYEQKRAKARRVAADYRS